MLDSSSAIGAGMSDERPDRVEKRLDGLEDGQHKLLVQYEDQRRLLMVVADGVAAANERVDAADDRVSGGFAALEKRMDHGFAQMDRRFTSLETVLTSFIETQDRINRDAADRDADRERRIKAM